jgi:hypothetical protein
MKRILAIIAVPLLAVGILAAIAFASQLVAGAFGPLIGWRATWGFAVCGAVIVAAFGADAIYRLIGFIEATAPDRNRRTEP